MSLHRIVFSTLVAALLASAAAAQPAPSSPRAAHREPTELLVRFRPGTPSAVRGLLAQKHGGLALERRSALGYDVLALPAGGSAKALSEALAREPGVLWAEPNGFCYASACVDCPQDRMLRPLDDALAQTGNQWGVFRTGLPWLWRQGGGGAASVKIAIIDSGIDAFGSPHPDLAANVLATGFDFVGGDADPTDTGPFAGHGTHVAGIAAAAADTGGIAGAGYACKLLIVRVLDCTAAEGCPGTFDAVAEGIRYAADQGARVINLSLGSRDSSRALRVAVQYAIARGAIVVAAAGNDSAATLSYPAAYPEVIAVGASDSLDLVPAFSNSGPGLDLVAPGTRIWSAWPGPSYRRANGTSMAAPLVAGVAAVIASRNPAITQEEMQRTLTSHVEPLAGDRDGAGRLAFPRLSDWSDLPPPYSAVAHGEHLWEWLGRDASAEPSISDPLDADHRPNLGGSHHTDGYDDGVLPLSIGKLPLLPAHIAPGASLDVAMSVSRASGPRYGPAPANSLHLDSWIDWDGDGAFEQAIPAAAEHVIADHVENPATWGADTRMVTRPITPVAEHILGNPLRVRTRLTYGASVGHPDSMARTGEVEDDHFVNFVEDFDTARRVHTSGVYMTMDTWDVAPDPSPPCTHRGAHRMGVSLHPAVGSPCNGFIERINVMATPPMDWSEYTRATLTFWYCHQASNCSPAGEFCRVRIDTSGVKHDVSPIPIGSGMMTLDLSPYVGAEVVLIEFVEHTDWNGRVAIDDVVVSAYDAQRPSAVTDLALARLSGSQRLDLAWTAPRDNDVAPTPPTQALANVHDVRYHTAPITSEAAWEAAQRVDPREWAGGSAVPGQPGLMQSASFDAPSAFQPYFVALRTGDEVVSLSLLSNSPSVGGMPSLSVDVLSLGDTLIMPGDTAEARFTVKNLGDAPDTYAIDAIDTKGWSLLGLPSAVMLAPGAEQLFVLPVVTSGGGGDRDTVRLVAWSMADSTVRGEGVSVIETSGTTDTDPGALSIAPGLHAVGPNPFRSALRFELQVTRSAPTSIGVYDLGGRLVRRLVDRVVPPGRHALTWDGRDSRGESVAAGMYYLRLRSDGLEQSRGLLRIR